MVVLPARRLGVALAIHALVVVVAAGLFGPDWEVRKVEELLRRERGRLEDGDPESGKGPS